MILVARHLRHSATRVILRIVILFCLLDKVVRVLMFILVIFVIFVQSYVAAG